MKFVIELIFMIENAWNLSNRKKIKKKIEIMVKNIGFVPIQILGELITQKYLSNIENLNPNDFEHKNYFAKHNSNLPNVLIILLVLAQVDLLLFV